MKKITCFFALFLVAFISNSFAQFEGKIDYHINEINDNGETDDSNTFTLFITSDRILISGEEAYSMAGSLETEGLLIRLDKEDFVLLTGDKQAMSISKAGITSFVNMFGNAEEMQEETDDVGISFENTGEMKTIEGYTAEKFVFMDEDEPNKKTVVWMTRDLDINWGMLAEPWGNSLRFFTGDNLPSGLIFEKGYFPVRMQHYEDETLKSEAVAEISSSAVDPSIVQISSDVTVKSLSQYMFQQMREEQ